jgi:hypothetical protein
MPIALPRGCQCQNPVARLISPDCIADFIDFLGWVRRKTKIQALKIDLIEKIVDN